MTPKRTNTWRGDQATLLSGTLVLIMAFTVVAALYFAQTVFIPLALAVLFSFLLAPVVERLERWKLGRVPAVIAVAVLALGVVAGISFVFAGQALELVRQFPSYEDNLRKKIVALRMPSTGSFARAAATFQALQTEYLGAAPSDGASSLPADQPTAPASEAAPAPAAERPSGVRDVIAHVLSPLLGPLGTAGVVIVFVIFMLIKREDLRNRLIHLAGTGAGRMNTTTKALDEAARKISRYLVMQLIVNVSYGVPVAIGLYFIGIPSAALWGLMAAVLRFIPYLGPWIAAAFPVLLSLAVSDSWSTPLLTISLFIVLELLSNNFMEPWLYGSSTGLSPVAVLVAALFWTWLWGMVGLLLSTPLTVCLAVLGKHVPSLGFLNILLGHEPSMPAQDRYYQRLLALDQEEAADLVETFLEHNSVTTLYSTVLVPALRRAEEDVNADSIGKRRLRFVCDAIRGLVVEIGSRPPDTTMEAEPTGAASGTSPQEPADRATVWCLPAAYETDEICSLMLAQLLQQSGCDARAASQKMLASEMVEMVASADCQVVCISAILPHHTLHAKLLSKLLRAKLPHVHIVVGVWDFERDEKRLGSRQGRLAADKVIASLQEAVEYIRSFATHGVV